MSHPSSQVKAHEAQTAARLEQIQKQFPNRAQGGRMQDKVCVITGAGSLKGIGRATAIVFAREGAKHLYLLDFAGDNLPALKSLITSQHPSTGVTTYTGDAADDALINDICETAARDHQRLDVFFANAGIATGAAMESTPAQQVTNMLRVNTLSCFIAVKHASRVMKQVKSNGSLILTASVAGIRSGAGSVEYSASKAAVISIAQTGANQLAGTGIRVNAICPGMIETGMTDATFVKAKSRGTLGKMGQLNPMQRYAVAEEIAYAALFLASDESSYVNGIALPVDGGLSSSHPIVPGKFH